MLSQHFVHRSLAVLTSLGTADGSIATRMGYVMERLPYPFVLAEYHEYHRLLLTFNGIPLDEIRQQTTLYYTQPVFTRRSAATVLVKKKRAATLWKDSETINYDLWGWYQS